jgi:hypothetical protein
MRATALCLLLPTLFLTGQLFAAPASAYDAEDPKNCNGVGWDNKSPWVIARVTAKPRVNFVKSPYDDDFKADTCPALSDACRRNTYLVTDDLVFVGAVHGAFTCINYQSPLAKKQVWATGWLPSAALTPVARMSPTKTSDWVGKWFHPGGPIEITEKAGGKLHVAGGITVPTARDFHNGEFAADVTPRDGMLDFTDDGSNYGDECHVQMQRIGAWLMVGDNGGCGGAGVTFQGLYRRAK